MGIWSKGEHEISNSVRSEESPSGRIVSKDMRDFKDLCIDNFTKGVSSLLVKQKEGGLVLKES